MGGTPTRTPIMPGLIHGVPLRLIFVVWRCMIVTVRDPATAEEEETSTVALSVMTQTMRMLRVNTVVQSILAILTAILVAITTFSIVALNANSSAIKENTANISRDVGALEGLGATEPEPTEPEPTEPEPTEPEPTEPEPTEPEPTEPEPTEPEPTEPEPTEPEPTEPEPTEPEPTEPEPTEPEPTEPEPTEPEPTEPEPTEPEPTEPEPTPTVRVARGDPGPTRIPREQGVPCSPASPLCLFVKIDLIDFDPGTYSIACTHDGWLDSGASTWWKFDMTVDSSGEASMHRTCFINFAKLTGESGVQVIVSRGDKEIDRSNWIK